MALKNEIPKLKPLLAEIDGVKRVTEGWPKDFDTLPCIAIEEAGNTPDEYKDDQEYITELEYYIRVFTNKIDENDRIADLVDDLTLPLNYIRTFAYKDNNADVKMRVLRYRIYL